MIRSSAIKPKRLVAAAVAAGCAMAPSSALAIVCTVSTMSANFGVYNPLVAAPLSTTGTIDIACTCTVLVDCVAFSYRVEVSPGQSGTTAQREMRAGSGRLRYNLYSDPSYSTVLGTGSAGYSTTYLVTLFGSKQTTTVYARAPAGQTVPAGAYADAPMVTITY